MRISSAPDASASATLWKSAARSVPTVTAAARTSTAATHKNASLIKEQRPNMPLEQVLRDIARHRRLALIQHVEIPRPHLRRNLIANVQQLAHVRVIRRVLRTARHGGGVIWVAPAADR